jgi:hypothetical protein
MLKSYKDIIIPTFYKTRRNLESLGYINEKNSGDNDIYKLIDDAELGTSDVGPPPQP